MMKFITIVQLCEKSNELQIPNNLFIFSKFLLRSVLSVRLNESRHLITFSNLAFWGVRRSMVYGTGYQITQIIAHSLMRYCISNSGWFYIRCNRAGHDIRQNLPYRPFNGRWVNRSNSFLYGWCYAYSIIEHKIWRMGYDYRPIISLLPHLLIISMSESYGNDMIH